MRVIIPCAGRQTRWKTDLSVVKHLVPICDEPVLHRTVRLINEYAPDVEVLIVVENHQDPAYRIAGSSRRKAKIGAANGDIDKIASSLHLWDADDANLILYGDVWWSRPALAGVFEQRDDWCAFARVGPRGIGGEIFGFYFPAGMSVVDQVAEISERVDDLATAGHNHKPVRGGWALYRLLCGAPLDSHGNYGHMVTVDDWTEDMDSRKDWDEWCFRWAVASEADRLEQVG